MGGERGVSQDFPDEHHWWIIAWVIFGCKSFLVLTYSLPLLKQASDRVTPHDRDTIFWPASKLLISMHAGKTNKSHFFQI